LRPYFNPDGFRVLVAETSAERQDQHDDGDEAAADQDRTASVLLGLALERSMLDEPLLRESARQQSFGERVRSRKHVELPFVRALTRHRILLLLDQCASNNIC
jgi:hypothetical protein